MYLGTMPWMVSISWSCRSNIVTVAKFCILSMSPTAKPTYKGNIWVCLNKRDFRKFYSEWVMKAIPGNRWNFASHFVFFISRNLALKFVVRFLKLGPNSESKSFLWSSSNCRKIVSRNNYESSSSKSLWTKNYI